MAYLLYICCVARDEKGATGKQQESTIKSSALISLAVSLNKRRRAKCTNEGASLQPTHPLTSICVITPLRTWFHMTRWPTGWTTKTRAGQGQQIQMVPLRLFLSSYGSWEEEKGREEISFHFL